MTPPNYPVYQITSFLCLFVFFFLVHRASSAEADDVCHSTSCGGIDIRFPFGLREVYPNRNPNPNQQGGGGCSYPKFQVRCDNQSRTLLSLPNSDELVIKSINYEYQTIKVNDPNDCLPRRFLHNLNLSDSPFKFDPTVYNPLNLTFLRCSSNFTESFPLFPVTCLSDHNNSSFSVIVMWLPGGVGPRRLSEWCDAISSVIVPISTTAVPPFWPPLTDDIQLTWTRPSCGDCEAQAQDCGFATDRGLRVACFPRPQKENSVGENGPLDKRWKWSRPNAHIYTSLIQGLASSLRVSDALRVIEYICEVTVSPDEEVRFGKIVRCPSCRIAVVVVQPQQGTQIASCAKCRYQYEFVSGDITSIQSEEISMDITPWERGLRFLRLMKQSTPAAVHSIVVQTPSGMARTHRFATKTVDLPAQEGERVTVAVAAPSNVYREVGPFKFSPRAPDYYPGEAMCLTNHKNGRESFLLRAPREEGSSSLLKPTFLVPLLALFATGDAASGFVDPSLPQFLSVVAVSSLAVGATLNSFVLPQLNQLPQGSVEAIAIKQRLLSQYDVLQSRIKDLKEASEKEVWMLARMFQLENKISAVGEPSYRARRIRIKRVQESLQNSLRGRIELIDNYARISSMIEIEVEMDTDVPAAETASNADSIMEQIQQIMELENLEEKWKIQAEANDEAERLLSSQPLPSEED